MTSHARYSGVFDWWFVRQEKKTISYFKMILQPRTSYFKKHFPISKKHKLFQPRNNQHVLSWRPAKKTLGRRGFHESS